jgi:hypothetical protein
MTTLMSGDDMPMGRVLPKVFADVPSAEELKQAHETARRARARAAGLMLVSVLLAGALLAAITFIVVSINSSPSGDLVTERDNALKEVTRLKGEETRLTGEVTRAQTAAEAIRTQFAVYSPVANLEAAISSRRDEVRKLIEQAPNANENNIRDVPGWNAYKGRANWPAYQNTGDWKGYVSENLQRQLASLDGLKAKIDAFIGGIGTPVIVTRPCTPSTPGFPNCG